VQACCGGLLSPAGGSTGLGAGLLSPAVAALDRLVASCSRGGVSPAGAALEARAGGGLLSPAVAALDRRVLAVSRRPSPPSTGLGAGRRRPVLAGRRRPRQACAGGVSQAVAALDWLRRGPAAASSRRPSPPSTGVCVFLWCYSLLLNERSGSQVASCPGPLGLSYLPTPKGLSHS